MTDVPFSPAHRLLSAASAFLATLDTNPTLSLTDEGIVFQQVAIDRQIQILAAKPELASHPGFAHYIQSLNTTLAQLAECFGQVSSPAYQAFLAQMPHTHEADRPNDELKG